MIIIILLVVVFGGYGLFSLIRYYFDKQEK